MSIYVHLEGAQEMISYLSKEDIPQVVKIHREELTGFLSKLGEEFLKKYYRQIINIPEVFTIVEKRNEQIIGFATGSEYSKGLYSKVLKGDPAGFIYVILKYLFTHPQGILKLVTVFAYPGFKIDSPELLTIAIDRNHQGKGSGSRLFAQVTEIFEKRKIYSFRIGVYRRLTANRFYRKMGCRLLSGFEFLGERMNYYIHDKFHKKINLILLTYDSLYANDIFLPLFRLPFVKVAGVVNSNTILHYRSKADSLIFLYKRHGPAYFLFKSLDQGIYMISRILRKIFHIGKTSLPEEARIRDIPVLDIRDINSKESIKTLQNLKPDIIISYFNQILKKEVLKLPTKVCLNVHPGYLPEFRGVASSLWARVKGKSYGGVTVHFMEEKLDIGDILYRKKIFFENGESLHKHNYRCCREGGKLLVKSLEDIYKGKVKRIKQGKGGYYSWPGRKDVGRYLGMGFKLMKWGDLRLYW